MFIISSTKSIATCTLINVFIVSLYKDTEEKIERGNHASLQDVAVIVCVHQEKTMEVSFNMLMNIQCL